MDSVSLKLIKNSKICLNNPTMLMNLIECLKDSFSHLELKPRTLKLLSWARINSVQPNLWKISTSHKQVWIMFWIKHQINHHWINAVLWTTIFSKLAIADSSNRRRRAKYRKIIRLLWKNYYKILNLLLVFNKQEQKVLPINEVELFQA